MERRKTMKPVKEQGLKELQAFKNRLARSYGMGKISKKDFDTANNKVVDLINFVNKMEEEEE